MVHIRQPQPDSGLGFQAKVVKAVECVPCSLGSWESERPDSPGHRIPVKLFFFVTALKPRVE
jgi:hypothetical protein